MCGSALPSVGHLAAVKGLPLEECPGEGGGAPALPSHFSCSGYIFLNSYVARHIPWPAVQDTYHFVKPILTVTLNRSELARKTTV